MGTGTPSDRSIAMLPPFSRLIGCVQFVLGCQPIMQAHLRRERAQPVTAASQAGDQGDIAACLADSRLRDSGIEQVCVVRRGVDPPVQLRLGRAVIPPDVLDAEWTSRVCLALAKPFMAQAVRLCHVPAMPVRQQVQFVRPAELAQPVLDAIDIDSDKHPRRIRTCRSG